MPLEKPYAQITMEAIEEMIKTAAQITRTISVVWYSCSKENHELPALFIVLFDTPGSELDLCLLNVFEVSESSE